MNFARLLARQVGLATVFGMAALSSQVRAQALDDGATPTYLKLDKAGAKNYFVRFGYTYIKPNTKSGIVTDGTGPVIARGEAQALVNAGLLKGTNGVACVPGTVSTPTYGVYGWSGGTNCASWGRNQARTLDTALDENNDNLPGMGIAPILTSNAVGAGMLTIQAGLFLDDENKWSVEPFVFGIPPENKVYGSGNNLLSGKLVATTQQLPLTVIVNRYFGDKDAALRASLGLGASYAIFFNSHPTEAMNEYAGGKTDMKIKNAFGYGPFAGLQFKLADHWHLNAQVGYIKLKTTAALTTHDMKLSDGTHLADAVKDFASLANDPNSKFYNTAGALCTALSCQPDGSIPANGELNVARFLKAIQDAKGGNLGTFTNYQKMALDPYVLTLGVGYEF